MSRIFLTTEGEVPEHQYKEFQAGKLVELVLMQVRKDSASELSDASANEIMLEIISKARVIRRHRDLVEYEVAQAVFDFIPQIARLVGVSKDDMYQFRDQVAKEMYEMALESGGGEW